MGGHLHTKSCSGGAALRSALDEGEACAFVRNAIIEIAAQAGRGARAAR